LVVITQNMRHFLPFGVVVATPGEAVNWGELMVNSFGGKAVFIGSRAKVRSHKWWYILACPIYILIEALSGYGIP